MLSGPIVGSGAEDMNEGSGAPACAAAVLVHHACCVELGRVRLSEKADLGSRTTVVYAQNRDG